VTRVGKLELRVPRDRDGRFSTALFERYQRSEKALVSALAEMYVMGVSTRKVTAITEELCGHRFSASTISEINQGLDAALARFAQRPLTESYPYLILDARYEKVRLDGIIQSQAVLVALGINWDGRREVLAVELANRESGASWTDFLVGLRERGLSGVEFVVSDAHHGIQQALQEVLPAAAWQRCYVHFLRNALDHLPRKADDDCLQELRRLPAGAALAVRPARSEGGAAGPGRLAEALGGALPQAHRLGGDPHRRDPDLLPAAAPAPQAPEEHQPAGTAERGDQAPHSGGTHLPERGVLPAPGAGAVRRDPRGLARGEPLPQHDSARRAEEAGPAPGRLIR